MNDKALDKLIDEFIESKWTMINASVDYFADSCVVSGIFRVQLRNMLDEARKGKPEPDTQSGLHITDATQQRELLIAYDEWAYDKGIHKDGQITHEKGVDMYLSNL